MSASFRAFASGEFSASHQVSGDPVCGRLHGHRWRVTVSIRAGQDPTSGITVGRNALAAAVAQFCSELDNDDVGVMLPGSQPTVEGVALAVRERLSLTFSIVEVAVSMDGAVGVSLT